jgi:hypothetical protein
LAAPAALPALPAAFAPASVNPGSSAGPAVNPAIISGALRDLGRGDDARPGRKSAPFGSLGDPKLDWIFDGAKAGRSATAEPAAKPAARIASSEVPSGKWDYFFGRVKSRVEPGMSKAEIRKQKHNAERSAQIARVLSENGIHDDPAGRAALLKLFQEAADAPTLREVPTERGLGLIKTAELPSATLEVSFYYAKDADGRVDLDAPPVVTSIIPKEH